MTLGWRKVDRVKRYLVGRIKNVGGSISDMLRRKGEWFVF